MNLALLTEEEFYSFAFNHKYKNFLQTPEMGKMRENVGWSKHYLGLKENDTLLCATMLTSSNKMFGLRMFCSFGGYLIDFDNTELVKTFTHKLKQFIKQHGGYVLKINPYVEKYERDINGDVVSDGFNNLKTVDLLKSMGFINNQLELDSVVVVEWGFALELKDKNADAILKEMHSNTRNIIRNTIKNGVEIKELSYKELDIFKKLTESTSNRKQFSDRPLSYYQNMYNYFINKKQIKFLIAQINLKNYISILEKDKEVELLRKSGISTSNAGYIKEIQITIDSLNKKIDEAKKIMLTNGETLILSGGMFMMYGDEVIYLFSGNYKEYMFFGGQYRIQWEMINYALDNGFKRYNFYGISGNFDPKDKDYGIYQFKRGFNGHVTQYIGEFELKINFFYHIKNIIDAIRERK